MSMETFEALAIAVVVLNIVAMVVMLVAFISILRRD